MVDFTAAPTRPNWRLLAPTAECMLGAAGGVRFDLGLDVVRFMLALEAYLLFSAWRISTFFC
jgi:hypothetical protein